MQIAIEILGLFFLIFVFLVMTGWKLISDKLIKRRYKPENDKGKLGEEWRLRNQKSIRAAISNPKPIKPVNNVPGTGVIEGSRDIQPSTTPSDRQDRDNIRETPNSIRKLFKRT